MKLIAALAALSVVSLGLARSAAAGGPTRVEYALDYQADAACSRADRFASEVAARLGFVPWADAPGQTLLVRIEADGAGFRGSLQRSGGPTKEMAAAACDTLVEALASAAAVAIDPGVLGYAAEAPFAAPGAASVIYVPRAEVYERRWATRTPWKVAGVGAATALVGLGAMIVARSNLGDFNTTISRECSGGCTPEQIDADPDLVRAYAIKYRAAWQNTIGTAALGLGAVATMAGLVMVAFNQPRPVEQPGLTIAPTADGAAVSFSGSF